MAWHDGLEGDALKIASHPGSPIHVLAGPGTGKTFIMMRRVARLIEEGADPKKVLAVTFTRTAAADLREQLADLGSEGASDVVATTLHSLSFRVLSSEQVFEMTHRVPRPLLRYERNFMVTDLAPLFGGKRAVKKLLEAYEAAWARLQTDVPGGPSDELDSRFHTATVDWLRYHHSILIGEVVPLTLAFVQQNPAAECLPRFEHVLVDEYQDLNRADQALIEALSRHASLTVIGDDNQSIYGFRHAHPEGIRTFTQDHQGTHSFTIRHCRRCPPNIVEMSNALIANDPGRFGDAPLIPDKNKPDAEITVVQFATMDEEASVVAAYVQHYLLSRPGLPAGQVLVLAPRRVIGNMIRDRLVDLQLNATSYFDEDPLKPAAAAKGLCLLALFVRPDDRVALRAWLGMESSTGLRGTYEKLRTHAEANQMDLNDVLTSLAAGEEQPKGCKRLVGRWNQLDQALEPLRDLVGLELVRALWPEDDESCDEVRLMAETVAVRQGRPDAILDELVTRITQPDIPGSTGDVIRVMSLHKSKGLTATLVIVAGCMAGALPSIDRTEPQATQEAAYREQRRLFYVAITRGKEGLVISSALQLPMSVAAQNGISIAKVRYGSSGAHAVTFVTPFLQEMGTTVPRSITGAQWRGREGF